MRGPRVARERRLAAAAACGRALPFSHAKQSQLDMLHAGAASLGKGMTREGCIHLHQHHPSFGQRPLPLRCLSTPHIPLLTHCFVSSDLFSIHSAESAAL
jgi:hypothetical protein